MTLRRGQLVRITRGPHDGKRGTIVKLNGSSAMVVLHGPDEIVLRGPGDMSRTAPVWVVKREHARETSFIYPYISALIEES